MERSQAMRRTPKEDTAEQNSKTFPLWEEFPPAVTAGTITFKNRFSPQVSIPSALAARPPIVSVIAFCCVCVVLSREKPRAGRSSSEPVRCRGPCARPSQCRALLTIIRTIHCDVYPIRIARGSESASSSSRETFFRDRLHRFRTSLVVPTRTSPHYCINI